MKAPMALVWSIEIVGCVAMIFLSIYAVVIVQSLYRKKQDVPLMLYLHAQTWAMAVFAVSRSVGHIAKRILLTSGRPDLWQAVAPFSGSINTITIVIFCLAALLYANVRQTSERVSALEKKRRELKASEESLTGALHDAENERAKTASILASIGDGISIQDRDFRIIYQNDVHKALIGDHEGELCYRAYEHSDTVCPGCPVAITFRDGGIHRAERRVERDDRILQVEITSSPMRDGTGAVIAAIEDVRDISIRKAMEEQLRHHALYDSLTNLPNRLLFFDRLSTLCARQKRNRELTFAVLFLDLDHFKKVNDTLGHLAGDELIVSVSQLLSSCVRPGDTVSRFGGDEFVLLLSDIQNREDALTIADRILDGVRRPLTVSGTDIYTSASIGVAIGGPEEVNAEDLLRDSDIAMYQAKASGRNRYIVFDRALHAGFLESLHLENALRLGLERNEFELYYQPVVDIESEAVAGFEALIRWRNPERGFILPDKFIPLAEETGLIIPIGEWVLREACRQASLWRSELAPHRSLFISVNISAKQFTDALPVVVAGVLDEFGLDPELLRIEITESTIMQNAESASAILKQLRSMRIHVCLDDFGTGYSSLNYLHRFPVDTLKIDHSFTRNIRNDRDAREIIRAIVTLAASLDMTIVVEGVEDLAQLEILRRLRCGHVQGYLFSEPLEAGRIASYMGNHLSTDASPSRDAARHPSPLAQPPF